MKRHRQVNQAKIAAIIVFAQLAVFGTVFADDPVCIHCGMRRSQYGHSWVIIEDENGRKTELCSIHCAAIDLVLKKDALIKAITVGDYHTAKQINAYSAHWVIGGDLPGVMTANAKWAFEKKAEAEAFISHHGGKLAVFEEVIQRVFGDMYEDTIAIKRKRIMERLNQQGPVE